MNCEDSIGLSGLSTTGRQFDDPFLLPSSGTMPTNIFNAIHWCRFLYFMNPQFRQASSRVISHFITDLDYPRLKDNKEKQLVDDILKNDIQLLVACREVGDEFACYGNGFVRVHLPMDRFLIDSRGSRHALSSFPAAKFSLKSMTYEVPNPISKKREKVKLRFQDMPVPDPQRIKIRRIDPLYITILHNPVTGSKQFIYRFEQQLVTDVKRGKRFVVDDLPIQMLEAIRDGLDFKFNRDELFHFTAPTISGVQNAGWGLPWVYANYRSLYQLQVYRKIDEAIGLDYMTPFRLFSPAPNMTVAGDMQATGIVSLAQWKMAIGNIIASRRRDKFAMHSLPFPVNYQEFAGDGKELTPKDLIEFQTNAMLDGMGFPAELFRGTLNYMQAPMAMRLFENTFMFLNVNYSNFIQWVADKVFPWLRRPRVAVKMQLPKVADALETKQILLQLAAAGEISRETVYRFFGIEDPVAEVKKRMEEDMQIERDKTRMQVDFQKEMALGQDGGEQGGQGGGITPLDAQSEAQELAQYWLQIPSDGERSKAMQTVRAQKPEVYAMAKQIMEEMRSQGASQGRQQVSGGGQQ